MIENFVLATQPRVGTHMLRTALRQHPDVFVHSELFNPRFEEFHAVQAIQKEFSLTVEKSVQFAFSQRAEKPCVGVVLHDSDLMSGFLTDWNNFPANLPAIKLRRRDKLAQMISYFAAEKNNRWQWYDETYTDPICPDIHKKEPALKPFRVEKSQIAAYVYRQRCVDLAYYSFEMSLGKQCLVWYEVLVEHWEKTMERIFNFLGVEPCCVQPQTKQLPIPARERVTNLDEVIGWCKANPAWRYLVND